MHATRATLATPPMPGAVAIIDLTGDNVTPLLSQITGINAWKPGAIRLVEFADIDQGLAVLLDEHHAQLMPHAGPRVVQRMMAKLIELGAQAVDSATFAQPGRNAPHIEVDMLDALWRAASPAAIDLLLAQPRLWREWLDADEKRADEVTGYSANLDRLLKPASVVIVGSPNVGKSTLSNTILGRAASIVADMPGTTRDFVSSPAEIDGVALRWLDTPGVRVTPDAIESSAISLAQNAIVNADLLVVLRDSEIGWPSLESLPRAPELYVIAKSERGANSMAGDPSEVLRVSSHTGAGIEAFTNIVLEKLGLTRAEREPRPWAFSPTLRGALMTLDWNLLRRYLGHE